MLSVSFYDFSYSWVSYFARIFFVFIVSHTMLKSKYKSIVSFFTVMAVGLFYSWATLPFLEKRQDAQSEFMIMGICYILMGILIGFLYKGKIFTKILSIILSFMGSTIASLLYIASKNLIVKDEMISGFENQTLLSDLLASALFVFSTSFIFAFVIKLIKSRSKKDLSYKSKFTILLLYPATHVLSLIMAYYPYLDKERMLNNDLDKTTIYLFFIFFTFCILVDIFILFFIEYVENVESKNTKMEIELVKNKLDYENMLMLKEEKTEFRKLKHDYSNLVNTAKGLIEIGNSEKALSLLSKTSDDIHNLSGFSICSNDTINTIMYIKTQEANKRNININFDVDESYQINIDDYDLCRILHNILDNAIHAVDDLDEKLINVFIDINDSNILIKTSNKYIKEKKNIFKDSSNEHGNGEKIVKDIVSKYKGKFESDETDNTWNVNIAIPNISK